MSDEKSYPDTENATPTNKTPKRAMVNGKPVRVGEDLDDAHRELTEYFMQINDEAGVYEANPLMSQIHDKLERLAHEGTPKRIVLSHRGLLVMGSWYPEHRADELSEAMTSGRFTETFSTADQVNILMQGFHSLATQVLQNTKHALRTEDSEDRQDACDTAIRLLRVIGDQVDALVRQVDFVKQGLHLEDEEGAK
jgi:hypothetical protein